MRTLSLLVCAALVGSASVASAQEATFQRAAVLTKDAGCTPHQVSRSRFIGSCPTKEKAAALQAELKKIANGMTAFDPNCTFDASGEKLQECKVFFERV